MRSSRGSWRHRAWPRGHRMRHHPTTHAVGGSTGRVTKRAVRVRHAPIRSSRPLCRGGCPGLGHRSESSGKHARTPASVPRRRAGFPESPLFIHKQDGRAGVRRRAKRMLNTPQVRTGHHVFAVSGIALSRRTTLLMAHFTECSQAFESSTGMRTVRLVAETTVADILRVMAPLQHARAACRAHF